MMMGRASSPRYGCSGSCSCRSGGDPLPLVPASCFCFSASTLSLYITPGSAPSSTASTTHARPESSAQRPARPPQRRIIAATIVAPLQSSGVSRGRPGLPSPDWGAQPPRLLLSEPSQINNSRDSDHSRAIKPNSAASTVAKLSISSARSTGGPPKGHQRLGALGRQKGP